MAIKIIGTTSGQEQEIDSISKAARNTDYNSSGREVSAHSKSTFVASGTFTPAATPTDLVVIQGSATKTVRVVHFQIVTTNTAAGSQQYQLIKRVSQNTGGTAVIATAVSLDTSDGASATAVVRHYTANPTVLGTSAGVMNTRRVASPVAVPGSFAGITANAGIDMCQPFSDYGLDKQPTLIGDTQLLCLNFGGAALVAGQTHAYTVIWTEE